MYLKRRDFIKVIGLVSASASPVAAILAKTFDVETDEIACVLDKQFNNEMQFHFIDNNLASFHYYFLNVEKKGHWLCPRDYGNNPSYMIIRLPQMHLSERGFWAEGGWTEPTNQSGSSNLSGFSWLAFRLWPDQITQDKIINGQATGFHLEPVPDKAKKIRFSLDVLLDWNNTQNFDLITLIEWFELKKSTVNEFNFRNYNSPVGDCSDLGNNKVYSDGTLQIKTRDENYSLIFQKYRGIVLKLMDGNLKPKDGIKDFVPISFFEMPQAICLIPFYRDYRGGLSSGMGVEKVNKKFWKYNFFKPGKTTTVTRKFEIWNNQLYFQRQQLKKDPSFDSSNSFVIENPLFRAAGLITKEKIPCPTTAEACTAACMTEKNNTNILPSLLDKTEIAYLTQFARSDGNHDFTTLEYDIQEVNGLFVTGLGVITHLKYKNTETLQGEVDLIEYEQIITQGRDVFIHVARLGYNSKTAQRYKHVIEGTRKIDLVKLMIDPTAGSVSFIELKQYCEHIDPSISYLEQEVMKPGWKNLFQKPDMVPVIPIAIPVTTNECDFKRNIFKELTVTEKKRIPIDCLTDSVLDPDICTLECAGWFWPIIMQPSNRTLNPDGTRKGVADTDPSIRYLPCEFDGIDWENQTISGSTPFMFIRQSYLVAGDPSEALKNYFKVNPSPSNADPYIERRKTYFDSKKIAYTPAAKSGSIPAEQSKNKVNILETEFIETYFNLKYVKNYVDHNINRTKYVLYPQMLRAKVYVDHIRDLTLQHIPSVVEYHQGYIDHSFDDYKMLPDGTATGNGAKIILQNTTAFSGNAEEAANNTYNQLTVALKDAKSRLGNLAVPDIIPNTICLEDFGITMPPGITGTISAGKGIIAQGQDKLNKLAQISPDSLLGNTEICGIKVTDILHTLIPSLPEDNHTPLFNINKMLGEVQGEVLQSPVYQKIINYTVTDPFDASAQPMSPGDLVNKYVQNVQTVTKQLQEARNSLNAAIKTLSNDIPTTDVINHLVKDLFERYRTIVFDMMLDSSAFKDIANKINSSKNSINDFLIQQTALLQDEFKSKISEIDNLFMQVNIGYLPAVLKTNGADSIDNFITTRLHQVYALQAAAPATDVLFNAVIDTDTVVEAGATQVYYVCNPDGSPISVTFELTDDKTKGLPLLAIAQTKLTSAGLIQLQDIINRFQQFIAKNIQGTGFQQNAVTIIQALVTSYNNKLTDVLTSATAMQTAIDGYLNDADAWCLLAENYLTNNTVVTPEMLDAIANVKAVILKSKPYADFIRKYDPYFYYTEQQRLKLQINDVQRRFFSSLAILFGEVDPSGMPICATPDPGTDFTTILCEVLGILTGYQKAVETYLSCRAANPNSGDCRVAFTNQFNNITQSDLGKITASAMTLVVATPAYQNSVAMYAEIEKYKKEVTGFENDLKTAASRYQSILQQEANTFAEPLEDKVLEFINEQTVALVEAVGADNIETITEDINEARNIYQLITSIKQQDLNYTWTTQDFKDTNFGIISFKQLSNPDTNLQVNVKATTYFSSGKFPPTIEKVAMRSENYFRNFALSFFNSLTIGFSEVSFISGSDTANQFNVKIKDVEFGGALSFVQVFEAYLRTLGKGFILKQENGYVSLGYSLPIPGIQTPAFSFFNLSLNFDLRVYFDHRPIQLGFSLATEDSKFGIAAFIYAGFGFFSIVADPKNGIVEVDCALEAGAWAGISIGPISGEVKLAFGFRYTKNQNGVRLEGYIVAEGRLSVWILEVSARIYLGIVSDNGVVEGECTVSYSVKLGFVSKTFSGTFHRHIAGAEAKNDKAAQDGLTDHYIEVIQTVMLRSIEAKLITKKFTTDRKKVKDAMMLVDGEKVDETYSVSDQDWKQFINLY